MVKSALFASCDEEYWQGFLHAMFLLLPFLLFAVWKWTFSPSKDQQNTPTLGNFLNELFALEVVLVAGAEMKKVKDSMKDETNEVKVKALKERLLQIAQALELKLQTITPIITFLTQQSVNVLKELSPEEVTSDMKETKKDQ